MKLALVLFLIAAVALLAWALLGRAPSTAAAEAEVRAAIAARDSARADRARALAARDSARSDLDRVQAQRRADSARYEAARAHVTTDAAHHVLVDGVPAVGVTPAIADRIAADDAVLASCQQAVAASARVLARDSVALAAGDAVLAADTTLDVARTHEVAAEQAAARGTFWRGAAVGAAVTGGAIALFKLLALLGR